MSVEQGPAYMQFQVPKGNGHHIMNKQLEGGLILSLSMESYKYVS